jgi:TPR repeat protein
MYDNGQGVEWNETLALKWYGKAAEQGYPDAQKKLKEYNDTKTS